MAQSNPGEKIAYPEYEGARFKSVDGNYFPVSENPGAVAFMNVLDYLEGRVTGLQIYHFRNGLKVPFIRNNQAIIYVDELPVDAGYLNLLPVSDIAFVKVIRGPEALVFGAPGVIAVYTLRGEE